MEEDFGNIDRESSWRAGQTNFAQFVYPTYLIEEQIVLIDQDAWINGGEIRRYYPMARPSLPFELAKIEDGNVEQAIQFANEWGLLGIRYWTEENPRQPHPSKEMEPLWVIWGHAYTMRYLLTLWRLLQKGRSDLIEETLMTLNRYEWGNSIDPLDDDPEVPQWFKDWRHSQERGAKWPGLGDKVNQTDLSESMKNTPGLMGAVVGAVAEYFREPEPGSYSLWENRAQSRNRWPGISRIYYEFTPTEGEQESNALEVMLTTISDHLRNVSTFFTIDGPLTNWTQLSAVRFGYKFEALFEVAYWHLGNLLAQGKSLAKCRECGAFFNQSDGRQQFCPPSELDVQHAIITRGRAQSKCGMRSRTNKARAQQGDKQ